MTMLKMSLGDLIVSLLCTISISSAFVFDPARLTRSRITVQYQNEPEGASEEHRKTHNNPVSEGTDVDNMDVVSWLRKNSLKVGNTSDFDLKVILESITQMTHSDSPNFPKVRVYNYDFGNGNLKELLVYSNPEEEKEWIVNIEDMDMRHNLVVFPLGDLGFGLPKEETLVVLRKSKSITDPFHYIHLAYLVSTRKKGKKLKDVRVEWDNIRPQDILPVPVSLRETKEDHESHCVPRKCGLMEVMFGTCPIVKLSCTAIHNLPIPKLDRERVDALIKGKQPFLYELARSLAKFPSRYIKSDEKDEDKVTANSVNFKATASTVNFKAKRGTYGRGDGHLGHIGDDESFHHSVKKDHAYVAPAVEAEISGDGNSDMKKRTISPVQNKTAPAKVPKPDKSDDKVKRTNVSDAVKNSTVPSPPIGTVTVQQKQISVQSTTTKAPQPPIVEDDSDEHGQSDESKLQPDELPSSFDLLLVKNSNVPSFVAQDSEISTSSKDSSKPVYSDSDSLFAEVLEKIRKSPPSKFTVRHLECAGCDKMGTFLSDFEDSVMISFLVNFLITEMVKVTSPSGKGLFSPEAYDILRENSLVPYIGYGTCDFSVDMLSRAPHSPEIDDLIDFYAESLGTNCKRKECEFQQIRAKLREMLTGKHHFLEIWPDLSIRFNKSSSVVQHPILSTTESKEFMTALIFSAYAIEYRMHSTHYADATFNNPNLANRRQSERMKFQTRVILRVVDELVKTHPQHLIKGLRFLLQILEDRYASLVAEVVGILNFDYVDSTRNKSFYLEANKNDRLQVIALKDFIINGVATLSRSGIGSFPSYITYFNRNYMRVIHSLVDYGVEKPPVVPGGRNLARSAKSSELEKLFRKIDAEANEDKGEEVDVVGEEREMPIIRKRYVKITRY